MNEEQAEIDFKSYDPKQISILSTAFTNSQFLIKFVLGIAIFIAISFLSIGILYIYIFPCIFFSLYMLFAIISIIKSITNSEPLKSNLVFQPLGNEARLSKLFYIEFLIVSGIVLIFNLEFSRRPQIMEVYGYHFVFLLNLGLLSGLFFGSKTIIETHNIAMIKVDDRGSDSSQSSNGFMLGLSGKRAVQLWTANLIILFLYLAILVTGLILFLLNSGSDSLLFFKIFLNIEGYDAVLNLDVLTIVMLFIYLGFFMILISRFYSSIGIVRANFPLIEEKLKGKTNNEKIVIRGLELFVKE